MTMACGLPLSPSSNKLRPNPSGYSYMLKSVFHLAGRQAQGFVESVFQLMNIPLPVPDHSTVSRRLAALSVSIPVQPQSRARHVVVDSVGVKVYGEGEWKARQHGVGKRRT